MLSPRIGAYLAELNTGAIELPFVWRVALKDGGAAALGAAGQVSGTDFTTVAGKGQILRHGAGLEQLSCPDARILLPVMNGSNQLPRDTLIKQVGRGLDERVAVRKLLSVV
jgi:hypothetical protein